MAESILYVDIENLQDIAKEAITAALEHWPEEFPRPAILKLYVKADQTELWKIWASHKIPSVEVVIKGVQHYTFTGSKNSADIAIALDAFADVVKERTQYVAVMSDDSDFAGLFAAIKQETGLAENSKVPFKWFMTNRPDTRSQLLNDFLPAEYIQTVVCSSPAVISKGPKPKRAAPVHKQNPPPASKPKKPAPAGNNLSEAEGIAKAIIKNMPAGPFKSTDTKKIIKQYFPNHPLAKADSAAFGNHFSKDIWPILEKYGVQLPNPNRKPRKYEMTEEAKKKVMSDEL
jgi:hypothetical protein